MQNKITDKVISIPPYISTCWSQIKALSINQNRALLISLVDGTTVEIPQLSEDEVRLIFHYHSDYLEKKVLPISTPAAATRTDLSQLNQLIGQGDGTIRLAFGSSIDGIEHMMQHNPQHANEPDLPKEILQKISAVVKIIFPVDELSLQPAEFGCNCFYCQIVRALHGQSLHGQSLHEQPVHGQLPLTHNEELEVADEELHFQQWIITQSDEKLFLVINPLDEQEKYNVFLGDPVGCTCGVRGCEHVLAVLKS